MMIKVLPRLCGAALLWAAFAAAAPASEAGWEALKRPGAVALIRHAYAPGGGDPDGFTLGDCATQRNLDERGRAQARAIGEAFRANGIAVDRVLSSQWCRCSETAELLGLGPVQPFPALNSFFDDRSTKDEQTRSVRAFLAARAPEERTVLVTHQVNISALAGAGVSSGEIVVVEHDGAGRVSVLATILTAP